MGYAFKKLDRELYILEDTLVWTKQKADEMLRAVIPPSIASLMRRGKYHLQSISLSTRIYLNILEIQ